MSETSQIIHPPKKNTISLTHLKNVEVMGIVNVTPDSFSDGGRFSSQEQTIAEALSMVDEGADILDIGGESTRPGAKPVPVDEELSRVLPIINSLARQWENFVFHISLPARTTSRSGRAGLYVINKKSFCLNARLFNSFIDYP